jgi:hypothetical protein
MFTLLPIFNQLADQQDARHEQIKVTCATPKNLPITPYDFNDFLKTVKKKERYIKQKCIIRMSSH